MNGYAHPPGECITCDARRRHDNRLTALEALAANEPAWTAAQMTGSLYIADCIRRGDLYSHSFANTRIAVVVLANEVARLRQIITDATAILTEQDPET